MRTRRIGVFLTAMASSLLALPRSAEAWNWIEHRDSAVYAVEAMKRPTAIPAGTDPTSWASFQAALSAAPAKLGQLRTDVMEDGYPVSSKPDNLGPSKGDRSACNYPKDLKVSQAGKVTAQYLTDHGLMPDRELSAGCGFGAPRKGHYTSVENAGYVLGWHAGGVDQIVGDGKMLLKPFNSVVIAKARELGIEIGNYGLLLALVPVVCLANWVRGRDCDPGDIKKDIDARTDFVQDGIDYLNPFNWWHPIKFEVDQARALWQFAHTFRDGHGTYNDLPGMNYLHAGPSGPGVMDVAIMGLSELSGLTESFSPIGWPGGTATVDANNNTGVDTYANYDERTRSDQAWERWPMHAVEFSSLDKLAAWGFGEFKKDPSHAAGLGWPLHALGDAANPQHIAGTTSWGHRPFEDAMQDNSVWLALANYDNEPRRARVHQYAYRWWKELGECRDLDIARLVREVARENHKVFGGWAYDDGLSYVYQFVDEDDAIAATKQITSGGKDFKELMRPAVENSLGAIVALLTCSAQYVKPLRDDPGAFCPTGLEYDSLNDTCVSPTTTTPPTIPVKPSIPDLTPPTTSCGSVGEFCANSAGCCSGLACTVGPNGLYLTCEDTTQPPRLCSATAQACVTRADCCYDAVCFAAPTKDSGVCGTNKRWPGETCTENSQCASEICYTSTGIPADGRCVAGPKGTPCRVAEDCETGLCINGACGEKKWNPEPCTADVECASSSCVSLACAPSDEDEPCRTKDDCTPGLVCMRRAYGVLNECRRLVPE